MKIVHYCHSPTRYLHGLVTEVDHQSLPFLYRLILPFFKWWLRLLDLDAVKKLNQKGTIWLTNSPFSRENIQKVYQVDSQVLYPPIELEHFQNLPRIYKKNLTENEDLNEDFYYYFSRISFHKRLDLPILACLKLGRKLKICGDSAFASEMDKLKKLVSDFEALNPDKTGLVEFLGRLENNERDSYLTKCRAFIYPPKEDFGIAPVEVLASGTPIIAFGQGGSLEYVIAKEGQKMEPRMENSANLEKTYFGNEAENEEKINGILFEEQTVESLSQAILDFEKVGNWNQDFIRQSVARFDQRVFVAKMREFCENN
jgi:glycosyltransferase involved in cell wall biosynthesis